MIQLGDVKNLCDILGHLSLLKVRHEEHKLREKVPEQVTSCGHYPEPAQSSPAVVPTSSVANHVWHVDAAKSGSCKCSVCVGGYLCVQISEDTGCSQ